MQCSREEQKTQHAVQEGFIKVNGLQPCGGLFFQVEPQEVNHVQQQRGHQSNHHHPDGHGQPQEPVIEIREPGRQADHDRENFKDIHKSRRSSEPFARSRRPCGAGPWLTIRFSEYESKAGVSQPATRFIQRSLSRIVGTFSGFQGSPKLTPGRHAPRPSFLRTQESSL